MSLCAPWVGSVTSSEAYVHIALGSCIAILALIICFGLTFVFVLVSLLFCSNHLIIFKAVNSRVSPWANSLTDFPEISALVNFFPIMFFCHRKLIFSFITFIVSMKIWTLMFKRLIQKHNMHVCMMHEHYAANDSTLFKHLHNLTMRYMWTHGLILLLVNHLNGNSSFLHECCHALQVIQATPPPPPPPQTSLDRVFHQPEVMPEVITSLAWWVMLLWSHCVPASGPH